MSTLTMNAGNSNTVNNSSINASTIGSSAMMEVTGLRKRFRDKEVICGIDFQVLQGEILCFLGPNGAGKSTTINIITGALRCESGNISYCGADIYRNLTAYKKNLGIVPQDLALYEDLPALTNVRFFASLYGLKGRQLDEGCRYALEFTGLMDRAKDKVSTFSGGMKRRLNIACAIAHRPRQLIMDEPTVGIDPQSRNHILEGVRRLRDEGMTILYTTHYMEEVEEIATRIIIMDEGRIIAEGTKEALKAGIDKERHYEIDASYDECPDAALLYQIGGINEVAINGSRIAIAAAKETETLDKIITTLIAGSVRINAIASRTANLETVFLHLTGKSLRD